MTGECREETYPGTEHHCSREFSEAERNDPCDMLHWFDDTVLRSSLPRLGIRYGDNAGAPRLRV